MKVLGKLRLKIWEDVQATPIEITTSSSDVADEEHLFFTQADGKNGTGKRTPGRKKQPRKKVTDWVAIDQPSSRKPISYKSQRSRETLPRTPKTETRQV